MINVTPRKEVLILANSSKASNIHHDVGGSWLHHVHTQQLSRDEHWCSAPFLLLIQSGPQFIEQDHPYLRWIPPTSNTVISLFLWQF